MLAEGQNVNLRFLASSAFSAIITPTTGVDMPASQLAYIAAGEIGTREETTEGQMRIRVYQTASWLAPGPWPWCAAFVAWCLREWLNTPENALACVSTGFPSAKTWRCADARAYGWETWAEKRGLAVFDEDQRMRAGDIVTFDFSHIGIVREDRGTIIETIEGNTSPGPTGSQRDGDGVYARQRARSLVRRVIRLPGAA
jgi:hypothetical protein